jgi:hypothetical protein
MTRINVGIKPSLLSREHLQAEHREIKRIPNKVSKGRYSLKGQPLEFKLGQGHEKFFYDKLGYLKNRYEQIYQQCKENNINVTYFGDAWDNVPSELMGDYTPTEKDKELLVERINQRLLDMQSKYLDKNRFDDVERLEKYFLE